MHIRAIVETSTFTERKHIKSDQLSLSSDCSIDGLGKILRRKRKRV